MFQPQMTLNKFKFSKNLIFFNGKKSILIRARRFENRRNHEEANMARDKVKIGSSIFHH